MTRRNVTILGLILALLLLGGGGWYLLRPAEPALRSPDAEAAETIGVNELHTMGNPKAKVTLIEYAALTCPHCAAFSQEVFPGFKQKYIDNGKVFYVYRLLMIDAADAKAEKIATCLPKAQYFPFIDMLYKRQAEWGPEQQGEHGAMFQPKTEAGLVQMARVAGMSADQAKACMADTAKDAQINQMTQSGVERYGIHSTPTFIVNGQVQTPGAKSLDQLSEIIDPMLK